MKLLKKNKIKNNLNTELTEMGVFSAVAGNQLSNQLQKRVLPALFHLRCPSQSYQRSARGRTHLTAVTSISCRSFSRQLLLYLLFICVIQHRNWPLRSTILNAHGTNASPDGRCTRTHTNEAFSCWFCGNSFRVDRARRGNVCLSSRGMVSYRSACP